MNAKDLEKKLICFIDLDDTLIKTASGKQFPEDCTDFRIRKEVLDKIIETMPNLVRLFIVSNQGGIAKGLVKKSEFEDKIVAISMFCDQRIQHFKFPEEALGFSCNFYFCPNDNPRDPMRKPNTGMLAKAYHDYVWEDRWDEPERDDDIVKGEMIMIGDASGKPGDFSDSDRKCAENYGIDYIDVEDFIKIPSTKKNERHGQNS